MPPITQPAVNPLNDAHHAQLTQVCRDCATTADIIDRLKQAGVPGMDEYHQQNEAQRKLASGLRQQFFPHLG
jgi:hypothetical protein